MVKAAVMAGSGRRGGTSTGEIDHGLPLTHPALMIPIIGLIIMGTMAIVTCFCKCWPALVPDSMKFFGKRSAEKNLELQLGRRTPRRPSSSEGYNGRSNDRRNRNSRSPSFNNQRREQGMSSANGGNLPYPLFPLTSVETPPPSYNTVSRGQGIQLV